MAGMSFRRLTIAVVSPREGRKDADCIPSCCIFILFFYVILRAFLRTKPLRQPIDGRILLSWFTVDAKVASLLSRSP